MGGSPPASLVQLLRGEASAKAQVLHARWKGESLVAGTFELTRLALLSAVERSGCQMERSGTSAFRPNLDRSGRGWDDAQRAQRWAFARTLGTPKSPGSIPGPSCRGVLAGLPHPTGLGFHGHPLEGTGVGDHFASRFCLARFFVHRK